MEIVTTKQDVSFKFPRWGTRWNPYDEQDGGKYPIFTGLIVRHRPTDGGRWDEMGFASTIDMDYKGKPDQVGNIIVAWHGSEKDFIKNCQELEIAIQEIIC